MKPQHWIDEARCLFAQDRPVDFCRDPKHCCECEEHEEVLQAHDVDSITYEELGNPGWDPMCFIGPAGFQYYFPALVRLTVEGGGDTDYVDQLLFHLALDGQNNERYLCFNEEQRQFVQKFLLWLIDQYAPKFKEWPMLQSQFDHAIHVWTAQDE